MEGLTLWLILCCGSMIVALIASIFIQISFNKNIEKYNKVIEEFEGEEK